MEMSQLYDEDLMENQFFQQFCETCSSLYHSAVENGWLICVPKVGTFESHTLTELDFLSHVLIETEPSQYKTASDKNVQIREKTIILGEGFDKPAKIQVLFNETFYTDIQTRYQVWCVDRPLSFEGTTPSASLHAQTAEFRIQNVEDSSELLFTGRDCSLKKIIDKLINSHKVALGLSDQSSSNLQLQGLIDTMHLLFTKCIIASSKDSTLKKRMNLNKHVADNLKISVETYINHTIYNDLFKFICTAMAGEDAKLNKINRNLSQIQLKDLGIVSEFSANIPRARRELLNFYSFSTPLAKMACVKRVILSLMQSPRNAEEIEPLTADDLIPMLVFLIVRSSLPTWMANFEYMTQFHFAKSSMDEYSFYISTLEAALYYVKSGELTKVLAEDQQKIATHFQTLHLELQLYALAVSEASKNRHKSGSPSRQKVSLVDTLFESIKIGDMDTVKSSLDSDADPTANPSNTSQSKKCHPLCSCDICERRLHEEEENPRTRVTVFSRDDRGFTAMHQAAMCNQPEIIDHLKQYGGVVNATDYHSSTPLHLACQKGHQSATMMLIDCGGDVNSSDNDGNRPIHLAALNGHEECINALIYQKSSCSALDVNAANENGDTALHLAAKWSYGAITELLVDHGAYPEARNRRNASPMMLVSDGKIARILTKAIETAQEQANDGFVELLSPVTPPSQPLFLASDISSQGKSAAVSLNPPVIKVSKKVKKFLRAVSDCDTQMMKHLMGWAEPEYDSSDTDSDIIEKELCHPLCQCRKCAPTQRGCSCSMVQASLVDINASDEQGRTALHIAAEKSNMEITTILLQKHADVNCKTNLVQFTPLHLACQQLTPDKQMVEMLIKHGAKVNSKDCNGRTPLHFASQTGSIMITQLLLQNKANVLATNIRGNTPLHEAAKVNNTDIVRELVSHSSNPLLTNKNGLTALQLTSDSKIRHMLTDAVEKYRLSDALDDLRPKCESVQDAQKAIESDSSLAPTSSRTTRHKSPSIRNEVFAALEADDTSRLHNILASINSFNKRTLKRTITRDRSSPMFSIAALNEARIAVQQETESSLAENEEGAVMFCASSEQWKQQGYSRLSSTQSTNSPLVNNTDVSIEPSQNEDKDTSGSYTRSLSMTEQTLFELSLEECLAKSTGEEEGSLSQEDVTPTNSSPDSPDSENPVRKQIESCNASFNKDNVHQATVVDDDMVAVTKDLACVKSNTRTNMNPEENRGDNADNTDDVTSDIDGGDNPECDFHLAANKVEEGEATEDGHYFEHSGTESADEH